MISCFMCFVELKCRKLTKSYLKESITLSELSIILYTQILNVRNLNYFDVICWRDVSHDCPVMFLIKKSFDHISAYNNIERAVSNPEQGFDTALSTINQWEQVPLSVSDTAHEISKCSVLSVCLRE